MMSLDILSYITSFLDYKEILTIFKHINNDFTNTRIREPKQPHGICIDRIFYRYGVMYAIDGNMWIYHDPFASMNEVFYLNDDKSSIVITKHGKSGQYTFIKYDSVFTVNGSSNKKCEILESSNYKLTNRDIRRILIGDYLLDRDSFRLNHLPNINIDYKINDDYGNLIPIFPVCKPMYKIMNIPKYIEPNTSTVMINVIINNKEYNLVRATNSMFYLTIIDEYENEDYTTLSWINVLYILNELKNMKQGLTYT